MKTLALALLYSFSAFAISEANYQRDFEAQVRPLWEKFQAQAFKGEDGVSIHYAQWSSSATARRCLVMLPGRSEQIEKYAELVHTVNERLPGEFIYILMDHRGQGSSGRMLSDSEKGHVVSFGDYAKDVKTLFEQVVKPHGCRETILFAHSMGGGIATDFVQKYPSYVDRLVLSSPMLKILTPPYPYPVARVLVFGFMTAGQGNKYSVGQKGFDANQTFSANVFTHSEARFDRWMMMFKELPATRLGGATNRWVSEVMKGTKRIRQHYRDVTVPTLVLVAGDEQYSHAEEMKKFCQVAPNCEERFFAQSRHEILMETDVVRDAAMQDLITFLQ